MILKELKNHILYSLYTLDKEKKPFSGDLVAFCQQNKLVYDDARQVKQAGQSLKELGLISGTAMLNDFFCSHLTPQGIEYVEENLLTEEDQLVDSLKDTTKMMSMGGVEIDDSDFHRGLSSELSSSFTHSKPNDINPTDDTNTAGSSNGDVTQLYSIADIDYSIHDKDVASCFGVDMLVDVFIKQIDKISTSSIESTPMIGILAPWGRGKSYFLDKVLGKLSRKRYRFVKFNAWKYQDTPALWAHLYATIYSTTNLFQRIMLWVDKYIFSKSFLLFFFVNVVVFILLQVSERLLGVNSNLNIVDYGLSIQILGCIMSWVYTFFDNPVSAYRLIRKYVRNSDYSEHLGIQNLIEKDLSRLLSWLSFKNKKVILCVDDIDRCSESKMLEVVDSLRTILENEEIAKNLLIICCADVTKLKTAYRKKYSGNENNTGQEERIREQLDKLFVFSLGLAPLGDAQLMEYLEQLQNANKVERKTGTPSIIVDMSRSKGELIPVSGSGELKVLEEKDIAGILKEEVIKCKDITLTPRRLRITYYQLLFAVNLASAQDINLTYDILKDIAEKSLTGNTVNLEDVALGDLVDMVVPY